MDKILVYLGWRRGADSVDLFTTWHTYAAMVIGLVVVVALTKFVF